MYCHKYCPVLLVQNFGRVRNHLSWEDSSDEFWPDLHLFRNLYSIFNVPEKSKTCWSRYWKIMPDFLHYHARQIKSKRKLSLSCYMKNYNVSYGNEYKSRRERTEIDWKINQKKCKLWATYQVCTISSTYISSLYHADITAASFPQCGISDILWSLQICRF